MLINNILAREIFDSRGYPTLEVEIHLENGIKDRASIPSGASKGSREAKELRDHDNQRFNGKGLLNNIRLIHDIIKPNLMGLNPKDQSKIDEILIKLDGSKDKSNLGANTLLAVSLAIAKIAAKLSNLPLFQYIGSYQHYILPIPLINIINGGIHADNLLDLQEFMIAPINANSFFESMRVASEIFHALKLILKEKGHSINYGDEGGFAPNISRSNEAIEYILQACKQAGYKAGKDVLIALDAAASEFYNNGYYQFKGYNKNLSSSELINYYENLVNFYPIYSIEDPMAEHDVEGWKEITNKLGQKIQLVGDDLFVTNPQILQKGIKQKLANAILIKPNQIGTLSETLQTIEIAKQNKYDIVISHRSGETEDTALAHLCVGTASNQIKAGSMCRSERLAKYNELIRISELVETETIYAGSFYKKFIC